MKQIKLYEIETYDEMLEAVKVVMGAGIAPIDLDEMTAKFASGNSGWYAANNMIFYNDSSENDGVTTEEIFAFHSKDIGLPKMSKDLTDKEIDLIESVVAGDSKKFDKADISKSIFWKMPGYYDEWCITGNDVAEKVIEKLPKIEDLHQRERSLMAEIGYQALDNGLLSEDCVNEDNNSDINDMIKEYDEVYAKRREMESTGRAKNKTLKMK